jgi:putative transposase
MARHRHTPEEIIRKLREADRLLAEGADVADVARHLEVSEQTYHRWRNQFGGMKAEDARRLKDLERENDRLKCRWSLSLPPWPTRSTSRSRTSAASPKRRRSRVVPTWTATSSSPPWRRADGQEGGRPRQRSRRASLSVLDPSARRRTARASSGGAEPSADTAWGAD